MKKERSGNNCFRSSLLKNCCMIQLKNRKLSERTMQALTGYQAEVDAFPTYAEQIAEAKRIWPSRKQNAPFREVKSTLTEMCAGARRCCYCEDSMADEVEHIFPKDFYPEKTFVWGNYIYACGPCNGPKGNQFAVFEPAQLNYTCLSHPHDSPPVKPSPGEPVLINPREENPLDFLWLDIQDSFAFTTVDDNPHSKTYCRAHYTINVLKLNQRDSLIEARRRAYENYRARLREYIQQREVNTNEEELQRLISGLQSEQHPTVWKEMQRQHAGIPELQTLFDEAPEALSW